MTIHCPVCRSHLPAYSLRTRITCDQCSNPLIANRKAAQWTFAALALLINGFIALVWLVLAESHASDDLIRGASMLMLPCGLITWALFAWISNLLTYVVLDKDSLPDGKAICRPSKRHYRPKVAVS